MSQGGSKTKVANRVVMLGSAAVLAVYSAGFSRTRLAAHKLEVQAALRTPPPAAEMPVPTAPPSSPLAAAPEPAAAREAPVKLAVVAAPVKPVPATPGRVEVEPTASPEPEAPAAAAVPSPYAPPPETKAEPPNPPAAPAPAPTPAPAAATPAPAAPSWKDGTYTGWGSSRHGDIEASVVIQGGRIESASISQCRTRYSCSVIGMLPPEVPQRQSAEVDYVSGATQSANAFYWAVMDALSKAK
ncbi:MAG TPA: FMN-binding protein [Bryobacteraceae bacterium]|nr:FMN-binding protein [Bryobacteraceae bacterium]